jgi:Asp-tRNA(Asn)/Glu-tRNA(Gln) amidotransferase C subunit
MSKEEVVNKLYELKSLAIKVQDYEMAAKLRDIENSFNGRYGRVYIEPTEENLKVEITKIVNYFTTLKYTDYNKNLLRDLKLKLLFNEL